MKRRYFLLLCLLMLSLPGLAQQVLEQKKKVTIKNLKLEEALYYLIDELEIPLSFSNELIPDRTITLPSGKYQVQNILKLLLEDTPLAYQVVGEQIILFRPKEIPPDEYTISGYLKDEASGESLIAASVYDFVNQLGTTTNEYGFYSLTIPKGAVQLQFSYLGYQPVYKNLELDKNHRINIALTTALTFEPVIVLANDTTLEHSRTGISSNYIAKRELENLPQLGGESDLVRITHLLPGVQTGADGVGGIHVRGGNAGQNLILIDGVPVYNLAHAAGVFSIFNTEAIKEAQLIKGGFPARYGGRLSSILDVKTKEGNKRTFKASGKISLLANSLSMEGPIIKDKSSFFVSGRWSFLNWYVKPITRTYKENRGETGLTSYRFHDINAKFNYSISDQNKIYFSLYSGSDDFSNTGTFSQNVVVLDSSVSESTFFRFDRNYTEQLSWGNNVAAFRWNHLFNDKLFANTTLTYSEMGVDLHYSSVDSVVEQLSQVTLLRRLDIGTYTSRIQDIGVKVDFDLIPSANHYYRFGLMVTRHQFEPGALVFDENTSDATVQQPSEPDQLINSVEYQVYFEDEIKIGKALVLHPGIRLSSVSVGAQNYQALEPRFSSLLTLTKFLRWKASYSQMVQHLHLLSRSNIGLPTDLWIPSTANIKPQEAWQTSTALEVDLFPDMGIQLTVEGYYKEMRNLLSYSDGALLFNDWEENVTAGNGRSYGLEILLRKQLGKSTGWISYTYSNTDRQFELVNFGRRFPYDFDRRNDFKIVGIHELAPWLRFSFNWTISSGMAYSLPNLAYQYILPGDPGTPIITEVIDAKNQQRFPYYHRLDFSFNFNFKSPKLLHQVNVGAYNTYNRQNPLYYALRPRVINVNNELLETNEVVQVSILPLLPVFSYSVKF